MLDYLTEYADAGYVPMHMPGAKRNKELFSMENPYKLDITEIDGFDNMHNPTGIIKEAFERCAHILGAEESLFLVNGSSAGILAAICGATEKGDKVVVARNSHVSVYNALYLNELFPIYVYPAINEYGFAQGITPEQIEDVMSDSVRAVIVTSPTYEGMVSDIKGIAAVAHKYGAVLIVDEAHGAHLRFHNIFPKSANECGADLVVQSVHKTLPSFTQTALLHMNGTLVNKERVKMYWNIYQSTSPSYLLMASIDRCVSIIESQGEALFGRYIEELVKLRKCLGELRHIKLCQVDDISKIVLVTQDGKALYDELLNTYKIQCEMASAKYVVAMTSIGDTKEYYERFFASLKAIDDNMPETCHTVYDSSYITVHDQYCSIYDAVNGKKEYVSIDDAAGRVATEKICLYPPGVPLVTAGEIIKEQDISIIKNALCSGIEVIGIKKEEVEVLCLR